MNIAIIVFYVVIIGAMMYFMAIKPQKKEQKRQQELMDSMEIGDYVLTTSGFYGVLIDISDDDVIVEFGNQRTSRHILWEWEHLPIFLSQWTEELISSTVYILQETVAMDMCILSLERLIFLMQSMRQIQHQLKKAVDVHAVRIIQEHM